jgi:isoquinoline 1-oxidoreductase alpha subunit
MSEGLKNNRRRACAGAIDVQRSAADVDRPADLRIAMEIAALADPFENYASGKEDEESDERNLESGPAHFRLDSGRRSEVPLNWGQGILLGKEFPAMIELRVNGAAKKFDGDVDMPLLWFLRDVLELTGTKFGCGLGLCGACTVHLNGAAVRSCQTTMKAAAGKSITTIEGLANGHLHPMQTAWEQGNVPQCGYCQAGQIMQAAALLKEKPKPTDKDIDDAMQGNICRCGTYQRIRAAIKVAAGVKA